jgi:hypothetical protein
MRENDRARLRQIQAERRQAQEKAKKLKPETTVPASAIDLFNEAKRAAAQTPALDISGIGFEFSNSPQPAKQAA